MRELTTFSEEPEPVPEIRTRTRCECEFMGLFCAIVYLPYVVYKSWMGRLNWGWTITMDFLFTLVQYEMLINSFFSLFFRIISPNFLYLFLVGSFSCTCSSFSSFFSYFIWSIFGLVLCTYSVYLFICSIFDLKPFGYRSRFNVIHFSLHFIYSNLIRSVFFRIFRLFPLFLWCFDCYVYFVCLIIITMESFSHMHIDILHICQRFYTFSQWIFDFCEKKTVKQHSKINF